MISPQTLIAMDTNGTNNTRIPSVAASRNLSDPNIEHLSSKETIALLTMAFIAFLENGFLVFVILSCNKLRKKVMYYFVLSLTSTQLLVVTMVLPLHCFYITSPIYGHATALTIMAYMGNLCALTHDRYVSVMSPLIYRTIMTKRKTLIQIIFCWMSAAIIQMLPVFWDKTDVQYVRVYQYLTVVVYFVIPLPYIVYAYSRIMRQVWKLFRVNYAEGPIKSLSDTSLKKSLMLESMNRLLAYTMEMPTIISPHTPRRDVDRTRSILQIPDDRGSEDRSGDKRRKQVFINLLKDMQIVIVFILVCLTYVVTWIPVMYMTILEVMGQLYLEPESMTLISIFLVAFNALVDPVLYGLGVREVRKAIATFIKKWRA